MQAGNALKPLDGVTVLDLTNVLAGPFCCHQLAHLGARVIKIEVPGKGDLARNLGADPDLNAKGMGVSFLAQNAGKQSLTLNLKTGKGQEILKMLVKRADVLVENFRPGVMKRLGLDYEILKEVNAGLVYAAISGFGQDGPWVHRPAYDQIIQGASGVMSITGDGQSAPLRVGYPLADTIGGLSAAMAICGALQAKPRGCMIDVSMLEAVIATMGWVVSNYLIAGVTPTANGNENVTSAPSGAFRAKDGLINIAANKDEQWEILAKHLKREDWLSHPDYLTREQRKLNRLALKAQIEGELRKKGAREWAKELNRLGVPAGAVLSVPEILDMPQIKERGMIATFDGVDKVKQPVNVLKTGIKINGKAPSVDNPPPTLSQHTDSILSELGLSPEEIELLKKERVI